jgi:hypothetical protein
MEVPRHRERMAGCPEVESEADVRRDAVTQSAHFGFRRNPQNVLHADVTNGALGVSRCKS